MGLSDEIRRVEDEWQIAVRDRDIAALDRLLAPEFTLTTGRPDAPVRTRAEYLRITAEMYVISTFSFEEIDVAELANDAALVRARYRQTGSMAGEDRSQTFLLSDVFARRGARWVAVARHSSGLPHP